MNVLVDDVIGPSSTKDANDEQRATHTANAPTVKIAQLIA